MWGRIASLVLVVVTLHGTRALATERGGTSKIVTNSIGMTFAFIYGECSAHGSSCINLQPTNGPGAFFLGITEVTQGQWSEVMQTNPSASKGLEHPVEMVTWGDAVRFCEALSRREGRRYTLPTKREWEHACTLGGPLSLEEEEAEFFGWFLSNSGGEGHRRVGMKRPNAMNLSDMHGNVAEWCSDGVVPRNGTSIGDEVERIAKGGAYANTARGARVEEDYTYSHDVQYSFVGFRVCYRPRGR